jgi:hypothetical protein
MVLDRGPCIDWPTQYDPCLRQDDLVVLTSNDYAVVLVHVGTCLEEATVRDPESLAHPLVVPLPTLGRVNPAREGRVDGHVVLDRLTHPIGTGLAAKHLRPVDEEVGVWHGRLP